MILVCLSCQYLGASKPYYQYLLDSLSLSPPHPSSLFLPFPTPQPPLPPPALLSFKSHTPLPRSNTLSCLSILLPTSTTSPTTTEGLLENHYPLWSVKNKLLVFILSFCLSFPGTRVFGLRCHNNRHLYPQCIRVHSIHDASTMVASPHYASKLTSINAARSAAVTKFILLTPAGDTFVSNIPTEVHLQFATIFKSSDSPTTLLLD